MIFDSNRFFADELPIPTTKAAFFDKNAIGDLNRPSTFSNLRPWLSAIPLPSFQLLSENVHCHWDGGSNSHIFTSKEFFYVLHPASGVITQVSGSSASVEGLGIVFIWIPKADIVLPLYPCYYAPSFPQHTISPPAIKHYNKYRSVRTEALSWVRLVSETGDKVFLKMNAQNHTTELLDYTTVEIMSFPDKVTSEPTTAVPSFSSTLAPEIPQSVVFPLSPCLLQMSCIH